MSVSPLSCLYGANLEDHTGARRRAWLLSSEIKKGGLAAVVSAFNARSELYRFSHESENSSQFFFNHL